MFNTTLSLDKTLRFYVQYNTKFLNKEKTTKLKSIVCIENLRPPLSSRGVKNVKVLDVVEGFHEGGWQKIVVKEVEDNGSVDGTCVNPEGKCHDTVHFKENEIRLPKYPTVESFSSYLSPNFV